MNAVKEAPFELIEAEPRAETPLAPVQEGRASVIESLITLAVQNNADIDKLDRVMAMRREFYAEEARKAFNEAFAGFKAEAVRVIRNKTVTDGPLKGKSYAELFTVVNAATEALSRYGLSTSWKLTKDEKDWIEVTCMLRHAGGHCETVSMAGPPDTGGAKSALQARASSITFLERYTLKAILGLAEQGDDSDGRNPPRNRADAPPPPDESLVEAGQAAATQGMKALTAWWGSLTEPQRKVLTSDFIGMRRAAAQFDNDKRGN